MPNPHPLVRGMLSIAVWGLVLACSVSFFYGAYELWAGNLLHSDIRLAIPGLGWQVSLPPFPVLLFFGLGLAANAVAWVARALGMDFGEFGDASISYDSGDDWDD